MTDFLARSYTQQQLGYFPHTAVTGNAWSYVKAGTCTGAGAADGTTLIDTNGDSAGADAYNGRYWVEILSGACKGEWRRVVDDNGAGTLTLENNGFPAQIASGVEYALHLSPEPIVVIDSSSAETNAVDAERTEADDFWIGYYLVPLTGNRRGRIALITDFTSATGTFVLAAGLGGVLATGDVCVLRKFVEASGIAAALEEAYIERPMGRVNFAFGDGLRGPRSGSFSFATHVYPSGSLAAAGSKANASVLSGLFAACGYVETINTSCTVGVGSTTGAVKIATGSWENLSVGAMVVWNGNPAWITSLADGAAAEDTVNITPALPLAPAASDVLYATRMYAKSTSAEVYGCGFEWEVDGVRHTVTGCMGNVALQDGDPLTMAWQFQVDQHVVDLEPAPYNAGAAYTTAQPVLAADRVAWVDTTKTSIAGFTASLNTTFAPKNIQGADGVNGRSAFQLTGIAAGCTWRELLNSATTSLPQLLRWLARTAVDLKVAFDSHGRTVGLRVPVARHRERPNVTDDGGLAATPNVMQAQDAGTATDGASAVQKVPDFSIHIA